MGSIHIPSQTEYHAPGSDDTALLHPMPLYRQLVGDLIYIADSAQPEITFVLGFLGVAISMPIVRHWTIMKAKLRNLSKASKYGLHFHPKSPMQINMQMVLKIQSQ